MSGDRCPVQPVSRVHTKAATQSHDSRHTHHQASRRTVLAERLPLEHRRQRRGRRRPLRSPSSSGSPPPTPPVVAHRVAERSQLRSKHPVRRFANERQSRHLLATSRSMTSPRRRRRLRVNRSRRRRLRNGGGLSIWNEQSTA